MSWEALRKGCGVVGSGRIWLPAEYVSVAANSVQKYLRNVGGIKLIATVTLYALNPTR